MKYGIPVFVTEHYSGVLEDQKWWRLRCFAKELNRKATAIYAVSNWLANRMERSGVYEVRGVIPNPIDTNMFRLSTRSPSNAIRMVSVGNPSNHKGTDILLESLCLLGDSIEWNLTLFGRKDHTNNYRKWLDDPFLANRVLLPGIVDQQSLAMSYANSDMYVLSSRVETFGVSMVQAMACGLPVVATRCGGPEEIITERVGMLVTKGDAHALAEGIRKMSYHPFDAAAIRSHVVERYSLEAVGKTITSIYQENLEALKRNASIGH
jgi:glycosyltransferase involved in cell wall biosynthesis